MGPVMGGRMMGGLAVTPGSGMRCALAGPPSAVPGVIASGGGADGVDFPSPPEPGGRVGAVDWAWDGGVAANRARASPAQSHHGTDSARCS